MSINDTILRANDYLKGRGTPDVGDVLAWRKELRSGGQPALARGLSRKLAERFIAGNEMRFDEADAIWKACKTDEAFSYARRVLGRLISSALHKNITPAKAGVEVSSAQKLLEQAALMTSKDPDLAASVRHDWALRILSPDLETSSAETLGIAGGIWKRRWEWDGNITSLEQSLRHYLAPVERDQPEPPALPVDRGGLGVTAGDGYTAINAAFLCDLLAHQTGDAATQRAYQTRAQALRERIRTVITGKSYWELVTRAEAQFGLGELKEARESLREAATKAADTWELETTARQLARLGSLGGMSIPDTASVVSALVGEGSARVESVLVGKMGLALSGGGFRASLYHLGVLARLAESDLLRHVEVLSTVSGGSMVGAAYYLRLRDLLQATRELKPSDYVDLVKKLIEDFRKGTESNLRNSLFTSFRCCHAILSGDDRAYSECVSQAIFRSLYSRTIAEDPQMSALAIVPEGRDSDFHPRYHNVDRAAKVPAIVINATTLNTGHSWQFTTTSMGESPFAIVAGADPLPRLRRSYYVDQLGTVVRPVTISQAVAASACVPGVFAPLTFPALYEGYEVRLVDGGVYDNQGVLALLQEDCNILIVSDASGQLGLSGVPGGGHFSPLLRSNDIFQERMRHASFERLRAMKRQGQIGGLAYVHLKKDLDAGPVDWVNCEDPTRNDDQLPGASIDNPNTSYGIWKDHQKRLAEIRTDLDVFGDIEAAALMASGYMAINAELKRLIADVPVLMHARQETTWFFSDVIPTLSAQHAELGNHLANGSKQFLRLVSLDHDVRRRVKVIGGIAAVVSAALIWATWTYSVTLSVGWFVLTVAGFVASYVARSTLGRWSWTVELTDPKGMLRSRATRWLVALTWSRMAQWVVPRLTRQYLEAGRLSRLGIPAVAPQRSTVPTDSNVGV